MDLQGTAGNAAVASVLGRGVPTAPSRPSGVRVQRACGPSCGCAGCGEERQGGVAVQADWWDDAKETASSTLGAVTDAASSAASSVGGAIANAGSAAWDAVSGAATGAVEAAQGAIGSATGGALGGGGGGPSPAGGARPGPGNIINNIGAVAKGALLSVGSGGAAVTAVQQMLAAVQPGATVSGLFDAGTAAAAKAFQTANGLAADGIIGPKTLAALKAAASGLSGGGSGGGPAGNVAGNVLGNSTRVLGDTPGDDKPDMTFGTFVSHLTRLQIAVAVAPACILKLFQEMGHVPDFLGALADAVGGNVAPLAHLIQREAACGVAFCLPSVITRGIVSYVIMGDKPRARKNLAHYMDGSGADLPQDVSALLRENPRIAAKVRTAGELAATAGGHKDVDDIGQGDYSSEDWRYALGNLDLVTVDVIDRSRRTMTVRLKDPYQWHPREERSTQCLHEFYEAAKTFGAREYLAVGDTVTTY